MAWLGHLLSPWANNSGQGNRAPCWPDLGLTFTPAAGGWCGQQPHRTHVRQRRTTADKTVYTGEALQGVSCVPSRHSGAAAFVPALHLRSSLRDHTGPQSRETPCAESGTAIWGKFLPSCFPLPKTATSVLEEAGWQEAGVSCPKTAGLQTFLEGQR